MSAAALQAPEVLEGEKATKASDMYGFGMVRCHSLVQCMEAVQVSTGRCNGGHAAACRWDCCTERCLLVPAQMLFELLTWRLPWSFAEMSPFKVGALPCLAWSAHVIAGHGQALLPARDKHGVCSPALLTELPSRSRSHFTGADRRHHSAGRSA